MLILRLLGKTLLLMAFLALAYDGVRVLASPGQGLLLTSISTHLRNVPQGREALEGFVLGHAPPFLWTGVVEPVLVLPVSLLFAVSGALIFLAGYRRPPPEIAGELRDRDFGSRFCEILDSARKALFRDAENETGQPQVKPGHKQLGFKRCSGRPRRH